MCGPARFRELTLEDILADPIVMLLMTRDGVDPDHIRRLMSRLKLWTPGR